MVRALSSVIVTTDSLLRTKAYYTEGLKLTVAGEFSLDSEAIQRLWGLERPYPVRSLVLKRRAGDDRGYVRLVEIEGARGVNVRADADNWDYGVFDLAFVVKDNEGKTAEIERMGFGVHAWPVRYDFPYYADREPYYVTEGVVNGPNETKVVFIERFNAPHPYGTLDVASGFSEMVHSAQVVESIVEATHFYHDVLGLPIRGEFRDMEGSQFEHILKISRDEKFDMSLLADPAIPGNCVELIHLHDRKGKTIAAQASLLNYGIAALSFESMDLPSVYRRVIEAAVEVVCEPMTLELDGAGSVEAFSCRGPSGILCEVYQKR